MSITIIIIAAICILVLCIYFSRKSSVKSKEEIVVKSNDPSASKEKQNAYLERIGYEAENQIVEIIKQKIEDGLEGYVLQNLYIPKENGGTTEIDAMLICTKGIYVFESKNFAGYIFGNEKQREWTASLLAGNKTEKHKFYNPIWQNNTHIKCLKRYLHTSIPIYSVIVFSDRGELKNVPKETESAVILQTKELERYLNLLQFRSVVVLTADEAYDIFLKLLPHIIVSEEEQQEHVTRANVRHDNPTICPWCGGKLIVRTAKKGANIGKQFYGCSNYPKCKYTRNIK